MLKRVEAVYSGRVQGVGFRFTAEAIAAKSGARGWVKNLNDGRVEVVAEAEEKALKDFLQGIDQYFSRYIQNVDIQWKASTGEFISFEIRF